MSLVGMITGIAEAVTAREAALKDKLLKDIALDNVHEANDKAKRKRLEGEPCGPIACDTRSDNTYAKVESTRGTAWRAT